MNSQADIRNLLKQVFRLRHWFQWSSWGTHPLPSWKLIKATLKARFFKEIGLLTFFLMSSLNIFDTAEVCGTTLKRWERYENNSHLSSTSKLIFGEYIQFRRQNQRLSLPFQRFSVSKTMPAKNGMVHFRLNDLYNLRCLVGEMAGRSGLGTCNHARSAPASPVYSETPPPVGCGRGNADEDSDFKPW